MTRARTSPGETVACAAADHQPQPAIFEWQEVVQVPPDLSGCLVIGRDPPSGKRGPLFGQEGELDELSSTQFLFDASAFFLARVLLNERFLLRYALDQLLRHRIELLFQLSDFISFRSRYPLRVVAAGELSCGFHQTVKATHHTARRQYAEDCTDRNNQGEPEQRGKEPEPHEREETSIHYWRHLYIDRAYRFVFPVQDWLDD